jgi:hypothetical protein
MSVTLSRRGFIGGLAALVAAPAVVRAASLMPVSAPKLMRGLQVGDVITCEGVYSVDRVTKLPLGYLRQFVVTSVESEPGAFDFYPRAEVGGPYATVTKLPDPKVPPTLVLR